MISSTEDKLDAAEAELTTVNTQIADIDTALAEQQAICDGTPPPPPSSDTGLFYLHADHLGRPQFATDTDGTIVWDMGEGVTPFGQGVNLAGAFAQRLMFPGQYADTETGEEVTLSHNWHRTYDPTLGRYLQSDPIGLAGGLNRYAYVGGNPVGWIDPDGLRSLLGLIVDFGTGFLVGAGTEVGVQTFKNGQFSPRLIIQAGLSGGAANAITGMFGIRNPFYSGALAGGIAGGVMSFANCEDYEGIGMGIFKGSVIGFLSGGVSKYTTKFVKKVTPGKDPNRISNFEKTAFDYQPSNAGESAGNAFAIAFTIFANSR